MWVLFKLVEITKENTYNGILSTRRNSVRKTCRKKNKRAQKEKKNRLSTLRLFGIVPNLTVYFKNFQKNGQITHFVGDEDYYFDFIFNSKMRSVIKKL